jgi:hypothetical protein
MRRACITPCFVNFQYPVVASGRCGAGAGFLEPVTNYDELGEKWRSVHDCLADVEVGVYGFSARSWLADESAGGSLRLWLNDEY